MEFLDPWILIPSSEPLTTLAWRLNGFGQTSEKKRKKYIHFFVSVTHEHYRGMVIFHEFLPVYILFSFHSKIASIQTITVIFHS